jgi:hypothetical protein
MYNKKPLSSSFKKNVTYECCIFHLINDTQNGGTLFILVFMDHAQKKNHYYQSQDEKKNGCFSIHMYTHQAQKHNTLHGKS